MTVVLNFNGMTMQIHMTHDLFLVPNGSAYSAGQQRTNSIELNTKLALDAYIPPFEAKEQLYSVCRHAMWSASNGTTSLVLSTNGCWAP